MATYSKSVVTGKAGSYAGEIRDEPLIDRLRRAEEAAVVEFCEAFRAPVFRYILYMTHTLTREDVEDLVQEVLLEAALKIERFKGASSLRTWVFGIARNKTLHRLRHERVRERREVALTEFKLDWDSQPGMTAIDELADDAGPDKHIIHQQEAEALRRALQRLKPEWREILILHYVDELSVDEITRVMGKSRSSIERSLTLSRRQLREWLAER